MIKKPDRFWCYSGAIMMNNSEKNKKDSVLMRAATLASVSVAVFLILIKMMAYTLTGSVTLLSSLLDSFLDSLASIINLVAVRHALEPADEEHRFGHGKAEPLAGFAQAGFIIASSGFLLFEAVRRLYNPEPIIYANIGIIVIVISLFATLGLVLFQKYVVKQTGSVAIEADSVHYMSDFLLNGLVIVSLVLVSWLGLPWLDSVFAIGIAIYILLSARKILLQSLGQLMDRELEDEERDKIVKLAKSHGLVFDVHDLRTRQSGRDIFIQFHLEMDKKLTLYEAHEIAQAVHNELLEHYPEADILIHQDPV